MTPAKSEIGNMNQTPEQNSEVRTATVDPLAEENPFKAMEPVADTKVSPALGIGAIALNFALKYHDIGMIKDGTLYQQYKLEGRNLETLHLDHVFETAIRIEMHLLASEKRIAQIIVDALTIKVEGDGDGAVGDREGDATRSEGA